MLVGGWEWLGLEGACKYQYMAAPAIPMIVAASWIFDRAGELKRRQMPATPKEPKNTRGSEMEFKMFVIVMCRLINYLNKYYNVFLYLKTISSFLY